jgi:hypothetical protein
MTAPRVPVALHHRLAALLWGDLPVLELACPRSRSR